MNTNEDKFLFKKEWYDILQDYDEATQAQMFYAIVDYGIAHIPPRIEDRILNNYLKLICADIDYQKYMTFDELELL